MTVIYNRPVHLTGLFNVRPKKSTSGLISYENEAVSTTIIVSTKTKMFLSVIRFVHRRCTDTPTQQHRQVLAKNALSTGPSHECTSLTNTDTTTCCCVFPSTLIVAIKARHRPTYEPRPGHLAERARTTIDTQRKAARYYNYHY